LFGLGTVGNGVAEILASRSDFDLQQVVTAHPEKHDVAVPMSTRLADILDDERIEIVIETIGGLEPARTIIETALQRGKSVVTANKQLMATYGDELLALASQNNVQLRYEAAIAGAIPIVNVLENSLALGDVEALVGVLNGTTNFMLTQMDAQQLTYAQALTQAQQAGFAEADPTFDVQGLDTAYKLHLLIKRAFGVDVPLSGLSFQGIETVTETDILVAQQWQMQIKLLAYARLEGGKLAVQVAPFFVSAAQNLARVRGAYNVIEIASLTAGTLTFSGLGAGQLPTAHAVVNDVLALSYQQTRPVARQEIPIITPAWRYVLRVQVLEPATVVAMLEKWQVTIDFERIDGYLIGRSLVLSAGQLASVVADLKGLSEVGVVVAMPIYEDNLYTT
jgi:homoserine dehydrogenase